MKLNLQMCSNKTLLVSVLDSVVLQKALLAEGDRLGFFYNFIYLFLFILTVLSLHCCAGSSLVLANGNCSLVVVHRLLIAVASLVASKGCRAHGLQ